MKNLFRDLWHGEPVYVIGGFTVIVVAIDQVVGVDWFGVVVVGVVAFNQWLQRKQVTPVKIKQGRHRKTGSVDKDS